MALRNHEIDNHLSMTPVNQKDKSSVWLAAACYSAGDRHSPRTLTPSPICQSTITSLADPICITRPTTNAIDENIDYCIMEKRDGPMFIHFICLLKPSEGVQNIPEITVDNALFYWGGI